MTDAAAARAAIAALVDLDPVIAHRWSVMDEHEQSRAEAWAAEAVARARESAAP